MKYTTNILNITDYGIIADRKTDVTQAINFCIKNIKPNSTIRFPRGDYLISSALDLSHQSNLSIVFDDKAVLIPNNKHFDALILRGNAPKKWFKILQYDIFKNACFISTKEQIPNCSVGTYLAIKSDRLLAGLNSRKTYQYEYRKIVNIITGLTTVYYFDIPLNYDFLIADNAMIGVAHILNNITLINPQINTQPETENELLGRGIIAGHCDNIHIQNPVIFHTKQARQSSNGHQGLSAIILNACMNSSVTDMTIKHIGWYGVAVMGACYNILLKKGLCQDTRHGVDASVWITDLYSYSGEPNMITIQDIESVESTESGFSTHDTGNHIKFIQCISKESGTISPGYGFIFRNPSIEASYCTASHSTLDGFHCKEGVHYAKIDYPTAFGNQRNGIYSLGGVCDIFEPNIFANNKAGIYANNGTIKGGASLDNSFAVRINWQKNHKLTLQNFYAKQSEKQKICFLIDNTPDEPMNNYLDLQKCQFENYDENNLFYNLI